MCQRTQVSRKQEWGVPPSSTCLFCSGPDGLDDARAVCYTESPAPKANHLRNPLTDAPGDSVRSGTPLVQSSWPIKSTIT